jgi:hypothetical protein
VALATTLHLITTAVRIVVVPPMKGVAGIVEILGIDSPATRFGNVTQLPVHALAFRMELGSNPFALQWRDLGVDVALTHGPPLR